MSKHNRSKRSTPVRGPSETTSTTLVNQQRVQDPINETRSHTQRTTISDTTEERVDFTDEQLLKPEYKEFHYLQQASNQNCDALEHIRYLSRPPFEIHHNGTPSFWSSSFSAKVDELANLPPKSVFENTDALQAVQLERRRLATWLQAGIDTSLGYMFSRATLAHALAVALDGYADDPSGSVSKQVLALSDKMTAMTFQHDEELRRHDKEINDLKSKLGMGNYVAVEALKEKHEAASIKAKNLQEELQKSSALLRASKEEATRKARLLAEAKRKADESSAAMVQDLYRRLEASEKAQKATQAELAAKIKELEDRTSDRDGLKSRLDELENKTIAQEWETAVSRNAQLDLSGKVSVLFQAVGGVSGFEPRIYR